MLHIDDKGYRKEFNYAADIVEAIWILVNQDKINESIIGCGKVYSILDWTKICFEIVNLNYQDYTIFKKKKTESQILISNPKTIHSIGWKPKKTFYDLAKIMMRHQLN
jgi:GDPmannose 4,6-dehydratase